MYIEYAEEQFRNYNICEKKDNIIYHGCDLPSGLLYYYKIIYALLFFPQLRFDSDIPT